MAEHRDEDSTVRLSRARVVAAAVATGDGDLRERQRRFSDFGGEVVGVVGIVRVRMGYDASGFSFSDVLNLRWYVQNRMNN